MKNILNFGTSHSSPLLTLSQLQHPSSAVVNMRPDQIIIIALSSHWIFAANGFSLRTTNKNSLLQQNIIRPDASILCSSHRIHRQEGSTTGASSSATSLYSVNDETQQQQQKSRPLFVELTPQERILKEALGIEPETYEEKQKRQNEQRRKVEQIQIEKRKNIAVAILSFTLACVNYFYQFTHPITSLTLLTEMQKKSDDLTLIGNNGKPTVIDFWAPVSHDFSLKELFIYSSCHDSFPGNRVSI